MKTLKEHVIFYDGACPLCQLYTKAFVRYQFLDEGGRATYQQMPERFTGLVNQNRAVNEIALINTNTGEVTYGVHSLIKILSTRFPFLKVLFRFQLFIWLASKAYRFVSYNRRIIMPPVKAQKVTHEPSLHIRYRILYLFITWIITAIILNAYSKTLFPLLPESTLARELMVCGGQILWQAAVISFIKKGKAWNYLGNLMTISFAGSMLLGLGLFTQFLFSINNSYLALGYFFLVVGLMFLEHIRRTRLLQLSWLLTLTWVLYRCIVLIFIL
jgi:predicted DCC family thiol-disulfide oxidoreductase YuxK